MRTSPDRVERFFRALTALQVRHPWALLGLTLLLTALAVLAARKLELHTSLGELLPSGKESVIVADRVNKRLPSVSSIVVVAEGRDNEGLKRFVDAVTPELRKIDPNLVGQVDSGIHATQEFFEKNKLLYAPLDLVNEVRDRIVDRYDYEVGQSLGTLLEEDDPPPPITEESIRKEIEERTPKTDTPLHQSYPGGYYLDPERHQIVVRVLTPLGSGDIERAEQLRSLVQQAVDRVQPKQFDPTIKVGLSGNLLTGVEAYLRIKGDLAHVGFWGVTGVLIVVLVFFMRLRTVVSMTVAVGAGAAWTFGASYFLVGHLNSSTGFLFSIIVGNGINFGVVYMARFLEARRDHGVEESAFTAHYETWSGTLSAALAAAASYGALSITDFRGFKQFGLIGGTGMVLCWITTELVLPVVLVLFEKLSPSNRKGGFRSVLAGHYGRPFAWLATRSPSVVIGISLLITLSSLALGARYVKLDPMEYNMRTVDNAATERPTEIRRLAQIADRILGKLRQDGLAIAVDRLEQVLPLKKALEARRDSVPKDQRPFDSVVTIHSLLPSDQEQKIARIGEIRETLDRARRRGFVKDQDWEKIQELVPEAGVKPIGIADLPEQMAQPFTEKDGRRGLLVYLGPKKDESVWDGHYLLRWADSFRRTVLPDGSVVQGSGRAVIFADVILAIVQDTPRALLASLLSTMLIILVTFRAKRDAWWVISSVMLGFTWTIGVLAIWKTSYAPETGLVVEGMKINFLNFVALPITIGVGVDYSVNVMQRYRISGGDMRRVIVETGGAVVLCSLTTLVSYLSLTLSINGAIRSFGIAAAIGELCCMLNGVLVLPALLYWLDQRKKKAQAAAV
ncbi:MAG: MMPL family transporter [Myxococcota bacterium]|nr:MMPL family transporter [Myxococcota bacterium]